MSRNLSIIVLETSPLISAGLADILNKSELKCQIAFAQSFDDIELIVAKKRCELVIVNPSFVQNNLKSFNTIKNRMTNAKCIGLIYSHHDPKLLSAFDALITISDTPESIVNTINKLFAYDEPIGKKLSQDILSEREIEVLILLASGMANKEIADKLNISINTVISHRKNISQKTGIKSVSGLTIYAVVQKLVSIDTLSE